MNAYGAMAQRHWQRWLPSRYTQISDPSSFFSTLGEQTQTRVADLTQDLAGPDPAGETYLQKVGRLTNARMRAEEIVLPETILLEPEPGLSDSPEEQDEQDEEESTQPEATDSGWIPLREDLSHPWWRQVAEEETLLHG